MTALLAAPVALALAVLGAHFWRAGDVALALLAVALIALLFVRKPWAARALRIALVAGTLEWLRALAALVAERQAMGLPYARLATILAGVALATALCALGFQSRAMRKRYRLRVG
jgi:hypothetical protein